MGAEYFFSYVEASVVCIAIFLILLWHDLKYRTRQEKQIWFDRTVLAHILYFISDMGWAAVLSGQLQRTRGLVIVFNFLNFILLSMIAYGWFMYMAASENMNLGRTRNQRRLLRLPIYIATAVMVIAFAVSPKFWVSDSGELNSLYYPLMLAAPLVYILLSFIFSMINARKAESKDDKILYRLIGLYPLAVVVFGIIQLAAVNAPLFCFGCTVMMLYFYIRSMQTMISVDTLTRMNNRGQIERYMAQVKYRENLPAYAAMIDIDHFKKINDSFGHAEGDRALILTADALKQTMGRIPGSAFIGRYGGDEFTVIVQSAEKNIMEQVTEWLREAVREKQRENNLLYNLEISIGYDVLQGGGDTIAACRKRADEKLYEDKKRNGTLRR